MNIDIFDIIYFLTALFMISIMFIGIDASFAIIFGFIIIAVWMQLKNLSNE